MQKPSSKNMQLAVLNKAKIFELCLKLSCLKSMLSIHTLFGILGTCKLLLSFCV